MKHIRAYLQSKLSKSLSDIRFRSIRLNPQGLVRISHRRRINTSNPKSNILTPFRRPLREILQTNPRSRGRPTNPNNPHRSHRSRHWLFFFSFKLSRWFLNFNAIKRIPRTQYLNWNIQWDRIKYGKPNRNGVIYY